MGVTILRPGQRIIAPGGGVRVMGVGGAASSWWLSGGISAANCAAAYAAKGAASLAASYGNLNAPGTNNAAPGVAPTWDVTNGWVFNGTTQYLTTGVVPAAGWSAIVRFSAVTNTGCIFGCQATGSDGGYFFIRPSISSNVRYLVGSSSGVLDKSPALTSGVLAVAGYAAYRNGSAETGSMSGYTQLSSAIHVASLNNAGSASTFFAGNIQALAIYNVVLTSGQIASLNSAISNL